MENKRWNEEYESTKKLLVDEMKKRPSLQKLIKLETGQVIIDFLVRIHLFTLQDIGVLEK